MVQESVTSRTLVLILSAAVLMGQVISSFKRELLPKQVPGYISVALPFWEAEAGGSEVEGFPLLCEFQDSQGYVRSCFRQTGGQTKRYCPEEAKVFNNQCREGHTCINKCVHGMTASPFIFL